MIAESIHVVLVEPQESLNVGSVARAMSNLGFTRLHLVKPRDYDPSRARITACNGGGVLEQLQIHHSIEACVSPMSLVVGFSGQHGKHRPEHVLLDQWLESYAESSFATTALLFGPEATGLRMEHLAHCRWTVRIPSAVENPSFNLAQAVLIVLYELSRRAVDATVTPRELASMEHLYQLDRIMQEVLEHCEFYREGTPGPIPDLVKNLMRRIEPDPREIGVLLALFARINSRLKRGSKEEADNP